MSSACSCRLEDSNICGTVLCHLHYSTLHCTILISLKCCRSHLPTPVARVPSTTPTLKNEGATCIAEQLHLNFLSREVLVEGMVAQNKSSARTIRTPCRAHQSFHNATNGDHCSFDSEETDGYRDSERGTRSLIVGQGRRRRHYIPTSSSPPSKQNVWRAEPAQRPRVSSTISGWDLLLRACRQSRPARDATGELRRPFDRSLGAGLASCFAFHLNALLDAEHISFEHALVEGLVRVSTIGFRSGDELSVLRCL